jgi:hypothetical protein
MNKYDLLLNYSNPQEVINKGRKMGYNVYISTRKNKKYQVERPDGKFVHFGLIPYQDFTFTHDERKRQLFINRNKKWANADPYSPAYLSYNLLW